MDNLKRGAVTKENVERNTLWSTTIDKDWIYLSTTQQEKGKILGAKTQAGI